jgi:predicted ATPase/signal transduction histidine kinase
MELQATDPPTRIQVLHEGPRARITRVFFNRQRIIRKEPLGADASARSDHERAILGRLQGVPGVAQLVDGGALYPGSIVLADAGDQCLTALPKPLDAAALNRVATRLAAAVAAMHARGVIHRDIHPGNIVCSARGDPCLVGFSTATTFAEIRPDYAHHSEIVGSLAYVAPEQTGRTGRSVDHRADLYALGATLYELATGTPPFGVGDPLRLIHDHLARVPVPPAQRNPEVAPLLSDIVMHLLEKEPDARSQTADGVLHDLTAGGQRHDGSHRPVSIGGHDVPLRLLPPSRPSGRDAEIATLRGAFADALDGRCHAVLISGSPGVGKTVLIDQLRSAVADADGWFVVGKFDQYRRNLEFNAAYQAFCALGRLLLAQPEAELDPLRARICQALGGNAGLMSSVIPEFATLLGGASDPGDPATAQARAQRVAADTLQAVATPQRPVVLVMDDLHWGSRTPLGFIDLLLSEPPIDGLLFVGAYREADIDAAHPLAAPLARWSRQATVRQLRLDGLPAPALTDLLADTLHVDTAAARPLAELVTPHTGGNPYETIELLNALRRLGLLTLTPAGWQWDIPAVRTQLEQSDSGALLPPSVAAIPPASRRLVEALACLGGRVELAVLQCATGLSPGAVEDALGAPFDEGLLVRDPGVRDAVRFRHDRIRDTVLQGLAAEDRRALHLAMARRLAAVPDLFAVAAEQYLPVVDAVRSANERRHAVDIFRRAAQQGSMIGDHAVIAGLMTGALRLLTPDDTDVLREVHTARHNALVSLGLFDEADEDYAAIVSMRPTALDRPVATALQIRSLTHRGRLVEAVELGVAALRECGLDVPTDDELDAELQRRFPTLLRWLDETDADDDLAMADVTDPRLLAAGRILDASLGPTFFTDLRMFAWISLEALRIWIEHGPSPTLAGTAANAAFQFVAARGEYAPAYRAARRILATAQARGYEPGASHVRNVFSLLNAWFEPLENAVAQSRLAHEGLVAGGDLGNAGYAIHQAITGLLDCGPSLTDLIAAVEEGLAFERRTGGEQAGQWLDTYQWLAGVLGGELARPAGEAAPAGNYADPLALQHLYTTRAIAAAIFGDVESLARHTKPLPTLPSTIVGFTISVLAYPLRGLALAWQLRETDGEQRAELLAELEPVMRWLVAHAADAPDNFLHLLHLVGAELAWARRDFHAAAVRFDAALRGVGELQRPWHQALIAERAGRFFLAHGLDRTAAELLGLARETYRAWGATAKADELNWERTHTTQAAASAVTTGTVDLIGILSASQALSSETSLERLHRRVVDVVTAMTGATVVRLLPWSSERNAWVVLSGVDSGRAPADPDHRGIPVSVLRYVQRTGDPLVVDDALADARFARDPYFTGLDLCSLLAVPVFSRGELRAVLLLENRLIRGAFSADRLDSVSLIAGQLAVSLDNAELYARWRRVADEQAALRRVATLVAQGGAPVAVFGAVADEMATLLGADGTTLCRYAAGDELIIVVHRGPGTRELPPGTRVRIDGPSVAGMVRSTRSPARMDSYGSSAGQVSALTQALAFRCGVGVPIVVDGQLWGAMVANWVSDEPPAADTEVRMAQFTQLLETAIANADSRDQLTASRARLLTEADQARRRVVRDLHDGAQQRLVHTIVTLKLALRALEQNPDEAAALIADAIEHAQLGNAELRELAHGMLPTALTTGGLRAGLEAVVTRLDLPVKVDLPAERLAAEIEASTYFIVAEALTNVVKHARASRAEVTVRADAGMLRIRVCDDGAGGADPRGHGLVGLDDRVTALGGHLTIESPRGGGTTLLATLPLEP